MCTHMYPLVGFKNKKYINQRHAWVGPGTRFLFLSARGGVWDASLG